MFFKNYKPLQREIEFTNIYKQNKNSDRHLRELNCIKAQLEGIFNPLKCEDTDVFAGHINPASIGLFSLKATSFVDELGYCFDKNAFFEAYDNAVRQKTLTTAELDKLIEIAEFWEKENTNAKIRSALTNQQASSLAGDDYKSESAAVYPLYRIAGVHLDFEKLLKLGLVGLQNEIEQTKINAKNDDELLFLRCMHAQIDVLRDVCLKYANYLEKISENYSGDRQVQLKNMSVCMWNLSCNAPRTLHEAAQLVYIYMAAADARELGRIDIYLTPFYSNDIKNGVLTRDEAVKLVVALFDMIERELHRDSRVIIGGLGRPNTKKADEFALVVLDALAMRPKAPTSGCNFHILPQVSLRCTQDMDKQVFDRAMQILGTGHTFPLLYNDDINISNVMRAMDVNKKIAEQYAFYGCGEYVLSAKSVGTPNTLLNVAKLLELTLNCGVDPITNRQIGPKTLEVSLIDSFETLVCEFKKQLDYASELSAKFQELVYDVCAKECDFALVSALMDNCIIRKKALLNGGVYHLGCTVETYGNITTADSFIAIKQVVFDEKAVSLQSVKTALLNNFAGSEMLKAKLEAAPKFGNDDESADNITSQIHEMICQSLRLQKNNTRLDSHLAVVINNRLNVGMGLNTGSTPDGRLEGVPLSNAVGAFNGRDKNGITALMRSMTKLDASIHAGGNQNFKLSPKHFENGAVSAKILINTFFRLGGQQCNISVVNQQDLQDALVNPEKHENLVVRVGGFTARFIDLDEDTKRDILKRCAY